MGIEKHGTDLEKSYSWQNVPTFSADMKGAILQSAEFNDPANVDVLDDVLKLQANVVRQVRNDYKIK